MQEPEMPQITPREVEILDCLKKGMKNREIASELYITKGTAKMHVEHIIDKLRDFGVTNRLQAAFWAQQYSPVGYKRKFRYKDADGKHIFT